MSPDLLQFSTGDLTPEQVQQTISSAFNDPNIARFYINGFHLGQGLSDVFIIMMNNGKAFGIMNMSFTTAKTLMVSLQEIMTNFEQKMDQKILTLYDIKEKVEPEKLKK